MIGLLINDELFAAYVEQLLVPAVALDEIVVLDNSGADEGRRAACPPRRVRASDMNAIAQLVASLNHLMRATWPRIVEAT